jgi:GPI mannosyltransferase 3
MTWLQFFAPFKALILVALPGVMESVFAALGDFYTWRLASEIYGAKSNVPWTAVSTI